MKQFDDTKYTGNIDFNWDGSEEYAGIMETFEPHISRVLKQYDEHPETVWTVLDDTSNDRGDILIAAGMRRDGFQYFISNEDWSGPDEAYIWSQSSME